MNLQSMMAMARKHLTTYLPAKTASLQAAGMLEEEIHGMARKAMQIRADLMAQSYPETAAEEVALKQAILVDPEPGADVGGWEADEMAKREKEYQAMMAL